MSMIPGLLDQGRAQLLVIANVLLLVAASLVLSLQRCVYGRAPCDGVENIVKKYIVKTAETLLVTYLIGERLDVDYILSFVALSAARVWAWMTEDRVKFVEGQPLTAWKLRAQFCISLPLTDTFNIMMFAYAASVQATGRQTMATFVFEFADLVLLSSSMTARYLLCIAEAVRRSSLTGTAILARHQSDGDRDALNAVCEEESGNMHWLFYVELYTGKDIYGTSF
ncbi:E3 ubiquitin-protein ligase hrd1 [Exophiala dermatitidis]|uniref:E3 ubiquitin-protein ligase hrd1 n=1 Tax=Exophiala dermatitidis TaxID=5970 RepID=A0AAN6IQE2_EXODE|nr:E3 ubiquitin-protein ligase hrd1 [Exophiala dermatitidis]KAJ4521623.1 E3 ubiquitin-protein ligase hrd1 [Exophiala dermatitidis]KAJ4531801.1 E3 ubiquitin-protein ligase hrd1 [Exophiala dermatitidis]KAJ4537365.1 E3 ubiquitin-protein ligase hrd1 [Exophiala dermatitidis]KAJ4554666.1 E3 ubiquitin-protein ligase hrd1 [Exophiala dermatitidis]